jgi:glutamate racemase
MNDAPIGVFDSGVGGLSCVEELIRLMPDEDIVYLGDTARVPYGTRSRDTIISYAREDIAFLKKHNVKMILVACGTVSSVLESVREECGDIPVSGVVMPAVRAAYEATGNGRIGIIATGASIRTGAYDRKLRELDDKLSVIGKACPMLVPLAENGYTSPDCPPARFFTEEYLKDIKAMGVDTLILGCTHFPHFSDVISEYMGSGVKLISSSAELAAHAAAELEGSGQRTSKTSQGRIDLYCTDSAQLFAENVRKFLGRDINAGISKCSLK